MFWLTLLQAIALATLSGSIIGIGALAAPVVFGQLPRTQAGDVMAPIFARLDTLMLVCGGVVFVALCLQWLLSKGVFGHCLTLPFWHKSFGKARLVAMGLLVLGILWTVYGINAKLFALRAQPDFATDTTKQAQFQTLHKQSEGSSKAVWVLSLAALAALL